MIYTDINLAVLAGVFVLGIAIGFLVHELVNRYL